MSSIYTKNDLLLTKITEFFKDTKAVHLMEKVITGNTVLSLRLLDWLVTNYSKKHSVNYGGINDLHSEYKNQLKAYSKKLFDPFCRRERIDISEFPIQTTIGQLNFFRWAIKNDVLKYATDNLHKIEEDMTKSLAGRKVTCKKRQRCVDNKSGFSRNCNEILISFE